jgi:PAS domain S-box-containing protein
MVMPGKDIKILLVEDNPGDVRLVREMLAEAGDQSFAVDWAPSLSAALDHLARGGIDLVLLDLGLPDSQGLDTFIRAYEHGSHLPFLVLTGYDDEALGPTVVRRGAQDYLPKGEVTGSILRRAIRYAIERKRAEKALKAEREKLFSVLNGLPAFVHLKGADFRLRFTNRRFTELFGEPGDRLCYELLQGRTEPCEHCRALEVLETRVPQKFEWISSLNDRIYEVHNYPFCADDGMLVLTLGIDITERQQAEEALRQSESRYRLIFDTMLQGIVYQDAEGKIFAMNPAAERILGKKPTELLGETSETVEHQTVRVDGSPFPGLEHPSMVALRIGQEVRDVVMGVYNPREQGYRWINISAVPLIREQDDRPYQVHTVFEDITERKQAEEASRESERKLRLLATQLLTAQEDERRRISHELHDELGHALLTLKLNLRSIEKELLPEQQLLSEEVESILRYIDEVIKNVRRLYLGLSPGDLEDLGITTALYSLINEFSQCNREITWSIELENIDGLLPLKFQTAIYRIFQEILTNIGKYAAPSHVSIIIRKRDKRAVFEVEDNGKGFNHEQYVSYSVKKGMGLIAIEERVRMMGGSFTIWSQENLGTRINFIIPID